MVAKNKHHYKSGCPIACALDILGDHWTLLVIRDLLFFGKHEYKDMLAGEEGISSGILSDRLKKLEQAGLISSVPHKTNKLRKLYYLTHKGKDLIYVMLDIARWSNKHLSDRIFIPEDMKPTIDNPIEAVAEMLLEQLKAWERINLH